MGEFREKEDNRTMLVKHFNWSRECFAIRCVLRKDSSTQRKVYCSRITGPDPNFILARDFVFCSHYVRSKCDYYEYVLEEDGIYEFAIKTIDAVSGERLNLERRWLIILGCDLYEYDGDELNNQYVLYTAYNLKQQSSMEDEMPITPVPEYPLLTGASEAPAIELPLLRLLK